MGGAATAVVVLTGVVAAAVDVGLVEVWPGLRSFVPQAGSRISAATEAAKPYTDCKTGRLKMSGAEIRRLIDHPVVRVHGMCGPVAPSEHTGSSAAHNSSVLG